RVYRLLVFFFFTAPTTTHLYPLPYTTLFRSLLWMTLRSPSRYYSLGFLTVAGFVAGVLFWGGFNTALEATNTERFCTSCHEMREDRKSTRLNSSHVKISYAVFCLKKKKKKPQ